MSSIKKLEKIKRLKRVYYSPKGYWRGFSAIKSPKKKQRVGLKNKQYGKFILLRQNIFHAQSLMFLFQMKFIKLICSSYRMIVPHVARSYTSML